MTSTCRAACDEQGAIPSERCRQREIQTGAHVLYEAIDHVILPVADVEAAAAPFRRLGLTLFPGADHAGRGTRNSGFITGADTGGFYVELLGITDRQAAGQAQGERFLQAIDSGAGLIGVLLR